VQHAFLTFEYGGMDRGFEAVWIDSFGNSEVRNIHSQSITEKGFKAHHTLTIKSGSSVTIIDSTGPRAFRFNDPLLDSLLSLPAASAPSSEEQFKSYFTRIGYEHTADTSVLGLQARVWKQRGTSNYLLEWKGLMVGKHAVGQSGQVDLILRSIDTTSPIDRSRFVVPKGIPIQPAPEHP
jgi:hypothetical protein